MLGHHICAPVPQQFMAREPHLKILCTSKEALQAADRHCRLQTLQVACRQTKNPDCLQTGRHCRQTMQIADRQADRHCRLQTGLQTLQTLVTADTAQTACRLHPGRQKLQIACRQTCRTHHQYRVARIRIGLSNPHLSCPPVANDDGKKRGQHPPLDACKTSCHAKCTILASELWSPLFSVGNTDTSQSSPNLFLLQHHMLTEHKAIACQEPCMRSRMPILKASNNMPFCGLMALAYIPPSHQASTCNLRRCPNC